MTRHGRPGREGIWNRKREIGPGWAAENPTGISVKLSVRLSLSLKTAVAGSRISHKSANNNTHPLELRCIRPFRYLTFCPFGLT